MLLDSVILADPTAPPAVLEVLAARGVPRPLTGALLAHPALEDIRAEELAAGRTLSVADLLAAVDTPGVQPGRLVALFARATHSTQRMFLATAPDIPGQVLEAFVQAARTRHRMTQRVPRAVSRLAAIHPSTPEQVHLQVLRQELSYEHLRADMIPLLLAATLRHPERLNDLVAQCRNHELATQLQDLAACPDPVAAYLSDAIERDRDGWRPSAVRATASPDRDRAVALCAYGDRELHSLLSVTNLPRTTRMTVLTEWARLHTGHLVGPVLAHATPLLERATPELVRVLASNASQSWHLPLPYQLDALDPQTLRDLWPAAQRTFRPLPSIRLAEYGFQIAAHPDCPDDVRDAVAAVVLNYGCSAEADRVTWFNAARALTALQDIRRVGHTGAALRLPVAAAKERRRGLSMHISVTHLTRAAVTACLTHLDDTDRARTFDALAPTFTGTFGELLDTVTAITA